jgi:predicted transcriptional regulator
MPTASRGLTKSQCDRIGKFLRLFTGVELALKARLHLPVNDWTGVGAMITNFEARNAYWTDSANYLRLFADIRNVLTHQLGTAGGYPVAVTSHSVEVLRGIESHLRKPEPVSHRYCRPVLTVASDHSLAAVLSMAVDNGFSQFPVVADGRFGGLITENEIIRWLGRRAKANPADVNLSSITVRTLLKEKDPFLKGIQIFHFERLDSPIEEVMSRFSIEPALEVILLTQSGSKHTPLEGIITQWDAARYPAPE